MDYSFLNNERRARGMIYADKKIINKLLILMMRAIFASVLIGAFMLAGAGIGLYLGIIRSAPTVSVLHIQPEIFTSIIFDNKTGREVDRLRGEENRIYATIAQMPENLTNAFVAIEDERFYTHNGIDVRGIGRAVFTAITTRGARTEGASTITQQLIKNNVMKRNSNTLITKLQEQYMAVQYEDDLIETLGSKQKTKEYILEVYINSINLGHGYYGAQTAASNYFDKDVSELTLSECAVIASITQNPVKYAPDTRPENNRERQIKVLEKMLELEMVTEAEFEAALRDDVHSRVLQGKRSESGGSTVHDYFIDAIITKLSEDLQEQYSLSPMEASNMIYNAGLQIFSTQDLELQAILDEVLVDDYMNENFFPPSLFEVDVEYNLYVKNSVTGTYEDFTKKQTVKSFEEAEALIERWKGDLLRPNDDIISERIFNIPQPQAAFIVIDYHNGQIKAMSGGRGEKTANRSLNRAVKSARQPGSVFKVLASYAPALDTGKINPGTLITDEPFSYAGYQFSNWWGNSYRGPQTVRRGIIESMNILAVKNMVATGIDLCFDYLIDFGFTTLVDRDVRHGEVFTDRTASAALGGLTDGITQLEVAAAYGTIANDGEYIKPILYTRVLDHDGKVLLENNPEPRRVLSPATAFMLTDIMTGVVRDPRGTGGRAAFKNSAMPIAGKTGTTTETKDLTFVGYTPYYVASVWEGYDMPKKMDIKDQSFHTRLWSYLMERIHEDLPIVEFEERPDSIVTATICRDSGKLATDLCKQGGRVYTELFIAGNQPTESCSSHYVVTVDVATNMRANPYCPVELRKTIVGVVLPDDLISDPDHQIAESVYYGPECYFHGPDSIIEPQIPNDFLGDQAEYHTQNPEESTSAWESFTITPRPQGETITPSPTQPYEVITPAPTPTPVPEYLPASTANPVEYQTAQPSNDNRQPVLDDPSYSH